MSETPLIDQQHEVKQLRAMAQRIWIIAGGAVSDRTRLILEAMAEEYELRARLLESTGMPDSTRDPFS